jgi:predicted transcriptional regulator
MKSVLISIQPKWCELIASGKKTVEVRKTRPKLETPFKVYIYETNWKDNTYWTNYHKEKLGKVIGEFVCNCITSFKAMSEVQALYNETQNSCLSHDEIIKYADGKKIYYWHISDLVIYDKPKELSEFSNGSSKFEFSDTKDGFPLKLSGMTRPPQSWCYAEEIRSESK